MAVQVKNGFDKMSEAALATEANFILSRMTGNKYFQKSQPAVDAVKVSNDEYRQSLDLAKGGGKENVAKKNAARLNLIATLRQLGAEVTAEATGNRVALESSGFPLPKAKTNSQPMVKPVPAVLKSGANSGEVICKGKKQKGAKSVIFMLTDDLTSDSWKQYPTSKSKVQVSGLTSAKVYYAKYQLLGVRDQMVESDVISYVIQ